MANQVTTGTVTDYVKSIVGDIMTMNPGDRLKYIRTSVREMYGENDVLNQFGVHLNLDAMAVKGVILEAPKLRYAHPTPAGRPPQTVTKTVENGRWNLTGMAFTETKEIKNWGVFNLSRSTKGQIRQLMKEMTKMANDELNMRMRGEPVLYEDNEYSIEEFLQMKKEQLLRMKGEKKLLDILFVFIDQPDADLHKLVKMCFDDICPTQVLTRSKTPFLNGKDRGFQGHIGNILSKVNQKMGGTNQKLAPTQQVSALSDFMGGVNDTAIVAAACSHPPPGAPGGTRREQIPTVAAVVCSTDSDATQYVHCLRAQAYDRDAINSFEGMIRVVLERRRSLTGKLPQRIIYLKDGVSDSGINTLIEAEVNAIQLVYRKMGVGNVPKILAVAVRRAHQTRFFPTTSDSRTNLPPGTFVLDNLSLPLPYANFYLLSHAGIKGTSHPARYVIVRDDFQLNDPKLKTLKKGDLHRYYGHLMYQLCHIYGRCQRTVSMPAPVYYANLLAERGREHISDGVKGFLGVTLTESAGLSGTGSNRSAVEGGGSETAAPTNTTGRTDLSGSTAQESRTVRQLTALLTELNNRLIDLDTMAKPHFYV